MTKYTLEAQSLRILRSILSVPGYAKNIEDSVRGARLLATVLPNPENRPQHEKMNFEMGNMDRDLCKAAYLHALAKEALPISEFLVDLCESLEFVSKPSEKKSA